MIFREASAARTSLGCLIALLIAAPLTAQQDTAPLSLDNLPTATLHVYVNRMQFPTLLLDNQERSLQRSQLNNFNITFDGGATFHPSSMHIEGDDPLAIAVLLDLSGGEEEILRNLPDALSALAPESLHPQDHLYFYALDCSLGGLTTPVAADPAAIRSGIASIMAAPVHGDHSCSKSLRLWDAISRISQDLAPNPARHVLLVVSRGINHDKHTTVAKLGQTSGYNSTAVFGIRDIREYFADHYTPVPTDLHDISRDPMLTLDPEDPMLDLCVRSGGFVLNIPATGLDGRLRHLIALLRSRYVLEVARPDKNFVGWHWMKVTVDGVRYALPTGDSAPVANNNILQAPDTIPTQPSPAVIGNRHVLQPKNP